MKDEHKSDNARAIVKCKNIKLERILHAAD